LTNKVSPQSLKNEGLSASLASVTRIIKKLRITGSVANLPRSGRPKKLSEDAKAFIDQQMQKKWWDDKQPDPEEAGEIRNFRMFSHRAKNEKEAWLNSAEDGILSAHPSPKQIVKV